MMCNILGNYLIYIEHNNPLKKPVFPVEFC